MFKKNENIVLIFIGVVLLALGFLCGTLYSSKKQETLTKEYKENSLEINYGDLSNTESSVVKEKGNNAFAWPTDNPNVDTAMKQEATAGRKVGTLVGYDKPNPK